MNNYIFNSPVYGKVVFNDPVIVKLINSPAMQRLKLVSQLGTRRFLNYNTDHNRFNHSLGVAYLIQFIFENNPYFKNFPTKIKQETIIAGLLHDIGHGPFSHDFEKHFFNFQHEKQGTEIILNSKSIINQILKHDNFNLQRITKLIIGSAKNDFAQSLISSQFDCDRMDYLLNDPIYIQKPLKKAIAWKTLLKALVLDSETQQIYFKISVLSEVENYLQSRYFLHKHQFWSTNHLLVFGFFKNIWMRLQHLHQKNQLSTKTLNSYECLFKKTVKIPYKTFLMWNDQQLITWFKNLKSILNDPIYDFFLENLFKPYRKENHIILRNFKLLENVSENELQLYNYLEFKFKISQYKRSKAPIWFINLKTRQKFKLEEISEFFIKPFHIEEKYRYWLW